MITNPYLLPKVRSEELMQAICVMPCEMRIASLVPGMQCASQSTVVGAHVGNIGKGTSTKVSDLAVCAVCLNCHDLYDRRNKAWEYLAKHCPAAVLERVFLGTMATQARLLGMGIITVQGARII